MDSLPLSGSQSTCESSNSSQHCSQSAFTYSSTETLTHNPPSSAAAVPYSTPTTLSSCAAEASASAISSTVHTAPETVVSEDIVHSPPSSTTFAAPAHSRQSPLPLSSGVASEPLVQPPPRSSDIRRQMSPCSSYQSRSVPSSSCRESAKHVPLEPPKKPLTPYMRFSKSIWFQVKAANPHLSVCQIGATIGRMWRELSEAEKQRHLHDFHQDKIRYDNELKRYMKSTGLRLKDLRAMAKSQPKSKNHGYSSSSGSCSQSAVTSSTVATAGGNSQLAAAFMGLPISAGVPMGVLGAAGAMGMLPSHFSQVWPTGQQYAGQPMMGIAASQLQLASQSGSQNLYSNGYTLTSGSNSATLASKSSANSRDVQMYRYSQHYL